MMAEVCLEGEGSAAPNGAALIEYIRAPQFKRLLSEVVARQDESDFRSIAVLSRYQGEGKTFLTGVLALGYAIFLRRRVLILDTIAQEGGGGLFLSRLLRETVSHPEHESLIEIVSSRSIESPNEDSILPPTPGLPAIDFGIADFLHRVGIDYDLVIVDTCALESSSAQTLDPVVVARQTDTAIVVTSSRSTEAGALEPLRQILKKSRVDILGTIHNGGSEQ